MSRSLGPPLAGAVAAIAATRVLWHLVPLATSGPALGTRVLLLTLHLGAGTLAYLCGYAATRAGRGDVAVLVAKLHRR